MESDDSEQEWMEEGSVDALIWNLGPEQVNPREAVTKLQEVDPDLKLSFTWLQDGQEVKEKDLALPGRAIKYFLVAQG